ncbi:hypothetical protein T484DRAFT_1668336 [Baffinella frigidus]|nr:hypothetical protein T484DRAFT_1668336 [Cryptophyta sp. CCMP2293]
MPDIRNPKPETRNPKPETRNPKPETGTRNLTRTPKTSPETPTRNPKQQPKTLTRNPKPETPTRYPKPDLSVCLKGLTTGDGPLAAGGAVHVVPNRPQTQHPKTATLNPQPSTLNPQPSTLNPQPSTLNPQPSTLNPQPSTLNPNVPQQVMDLSRPVGPFMWGVIPPLTSQWQARAPSTFQGFGIRVCA